MIYAVIDTNVLVSALFAKQADSATVVVMDKVLSRQIVPLYNDDIINEYQDVLNRDKFRFDPAQVCNLIDQIKILGEDTARTTFNAKMIDEKDRVFYEISLTKEDSYLVTGNKKHFPATPKVVTPAEMLAILG